MQFAPGAEPLWVHNLVAALDEQAQQLLVHRGCVRAVGKGRGRMLDGWSARGARQHDAHCHRQLPGCSAGLHHLPLNSPTALPPPHPARSRCGRGPMMHPFSLHISCLSHTNKCPTTLTLLVVAAGGAHDARHAGGHVHHLARHAPLSGLRLGRVQVERRSALWGKEVAGWQGQSEVTVQLAGCRRLPSMCSHAAHPCTQGVRQNKRRAAPWACRGSTQAPRARSTG